jgi:hypothetical protein
MSVRLVRPRGDVCRERAAVVAEKKYKILISEKREEYAAKRDIKIMQQIIKLSKEKLKYEEKVWKHCVDNYVEAADSISRTISEEKRKKFGLKEFSDYMIKHLSEI